jgi:branched-chain amino acid transport system permease protein
VVIASPEIFRQFATARLLVFGLLLVLIMVLRPQGIWPETGLGLERRARSVARAVRGFTRPSTRRPDDGAP